MRVGGAEALPERLARLIRLEQDVGQPALLRRRRDRGLLRAAADEQERRCPPASAKLPLRRAPSGPRGPGPGCPSSRRRICRRAPIRRAADSRPAPPDAAARRPPSSGSPRSSSDRRPAPPRARASAARARRWPRRGAASRRATSATAIRRGRAPAPCRDSPPPRERDPAASSRAALRAAARPSPRRPRRAADRSWRRRHRPAAQAGTASRSRRRRSSGNRARGRRRLPRPNARRPDPVDFDAVDHLVRRERCRRVVVAQPARHDLHLGRPPPPMPPRGPSASGSLPNDRGRRSG